MPGRGRHRLAKRGHGFALTSERGQTSHMLCHQLRVCMAAGAKAGGHLNRLGWALRVVVVARKHQRRAWIRRRSRTGALQQRLGFAGPAAVEQKFAEGCLRGSPTRIEHKRFTQGGFRTGIIPKRLLGTG